MKKIVVSRGKIRLFKFSSCGYETYIFVNEM